MKPTNINHGWAQLIIEELIRNDVTYFCIAPGSRSAPLTVQAALHPKAKTFVHFDERGLGFHALGYASATGKPCCIITTSGTACANLFPAIIEASKKKLPLIILTADRPPELRFTGDHQTIDQVKIFGDYVRWFVDMPTPSVEIAPEFVLTTVDQAIMRAFGELKGPVHINCMFREPLAPVSDKTNLTKYLSSISRWANAKTPFTQYVRPDLNLSKDKLAVVTKAIGQIHNGLIVVGKLSSTEEESVVKLADKLHWPVFPDITSGLRLGPKRKNVITHFDQLLLSNKYRSKMKFDGVLHLGGRITSKRYYDLVRNLKPAHYISVLNHPLRNDPLHQVTLRLQHSVKNVCEALTSHVHPRKTNPLLASLIKADQTAGQILKAALQDGPLSEFATAQLITEHISKDHGLFLASSLPIREIDMYGLSDHAHVKIGSNRGASGIDGTIASACGYSIGLDKPVTLLIGDLAFLHDLNSLAMLKDLVHPMTIVVLNNDGGGIFSFLPMAQHKDVFEKYFGTPHGREFEQAASLFDLDYAQPPTAEFFVEAYTASLGRKGSMILEIKSDRQRNTTLQQAIAKKINATLK